MLHASMDVETMRRKRATLQLDSAVLVPVDGWMWPGKVVPRAPRGGPNVLRDPYLRTVELFEHPWYGLRVMHVRCLEDYCGELRAGRPAGNNEQIPRHMLRHFARASAAAEKHIAEWGPYEQKAALRLRRQREKEETKHVVAEVRCEDDIDDTQWMDASDGSQSEDVAAAADESHSQSPTQWKDVGADESQSQPQLVNGVGVGGSSSQQQKGLGGDEMRRPGGVKRSKDEAEMLDDEEEKDGKKNKVYHGFVHRVQRLLGTSSS